MKSLFTSIAFLLLAFSANAQDFIKINNDTVYLNKRYAGYRVQEDGKRVIYMNSRYHASTLNRRRNLVDDYDYVKVGKDVLMEFNPVDNTIYDYLGNKIGKYEVIKKINIPLITKITRLTDFYEPLDFLESWRHSSVKQFSLISTVRNDKDEAMRLKREQERLIREYNQSMKALERQRIERFYAQVYERLSGDLTPIEGVYKSIDLGEKFEYDIAVLQSNDNERELIGVILSSTDVALSVGSRIFTFEKTAQPNLFFAQYKLKSGESKDNKTALLEGGILKMGLKSFIKMYPSEGEKRRYEEVNPVFDWESSGSGVLINQSGYIVTNNHVATGAKKIRIAFQNDSIDYEAVIVSQNEENDIAILKIVDDRFKCDLDPVRWNTSFSLGQKVFTLGYPISNKMSDNVKVVDGIVSGQTGLNGALNYFQTTLPVWYGNSGGPCFNAKGEILGLATQILFDKGAKVDNVAYITKSDNILNLAGDLIFDDKASSEEKSLEELITELVPYSVFIKVNY